MIFQARQHKHAVTDLTVRGSEISLMWTYGNQRRTITTKRSNSSDLADAVTVTAALLRDSKPAGFASVEDVVVGPHRCVTTDTQVVGLWIHKRWVDDKTIPPMVTIPLTSVDEVTKAMREANPKIASEIPTIIDQPKGAGLRFDYRLIASIYRKSEAEIWLRLEQPYGQNKAAVIYIPERGVKEWLNAVQECMANNEDCNVGVFTLKRMPRQVVTSYFQSAGKRGLPSDVSNSGLRIPDAAFQVVRMRLSNFMQDTA